MVFVYCVTNLANPGLFIQANIGFISEIDWKIEFIVLMINFPDMVGRFTYRFLPTSSKMVLYCLAIFRLVFLAILFLSCFKISIFAYDGVKIANTVIFQFLHGYTSNGLFAVCF